MTGDSATVRRILIGTSPDYATSVPTCLAAEPTSVQSCAVDYSSPTSQYASVLARDTQIALASKAKLIPVSQWLCYAHHCSPVVLNMMTVVDRDHLSIVYSKYLSRVLGAALKRDSV